MGAPKKQADDRSFSEQLRADLFAGRFRPGEWLKQADLESHYRANRFEVRIALSEMAARHLLDHIPNKGYRVANPSERQRAELYQVRTILETAAARLLVARVTDADVEKFAELVHAFGHAIEAGGNARLRDVNYRLHDMLYRLCGNDLLADQIQELRERGAHNKPGTWSTVAGIRASNTDHVEMLEMLRRRDGEGLAHIVYNHLNRWKEYGISEEE